MPGILTTLFDEGSSPGSESQVQSYDAGADAGLDLSPSVGVSHDAEASWTDAEGTEHTYASDTDVGLTVDVDATLDATGSLVTSSYEEG